LSHRKNEDSTEYGGCVASVGVSIKGRVFGERGTT
jgi:hypothetical protein